MRDLGTHAITCPSLFGSIDIEAGDEDVVDSGTPETADPEPQNEEASQLDTLFKEMPYTFISADDPIVESCVFVLTTIPYSLLYNSLKQVTSFVDIRIPATQHSRSQPRW